MSAGIRPAGPKRPPRPALVELATAMLIVAGFVSFVTSLQAVLALEQRGELSPVLAIVSLALGFASVATGVALRYGRWWLFGVNFVAVAAFLELTSFTGVGLLSGAIDLFFVVVLLVHRSWFAWTPDGTPANRDTD
jgi:hypothetical protein